MAEKTVPSGMYVRLVWWISMRSVTPSRRRPALFGSHGPPCSANPSDKMGAQGFEVVGPKPRWQVRIVPDAISANGTPTQPPNRAESPPIGRRL